MNKWIKIDGYSSNKYKCPYCGWIGNSLTVMCITCPMCNSKVIDKEDKE